MRTSAYMPAIAASAKTIAFGDFSYYWIADRPVSYTHLDVYKRQGEDIVRKVGDRRAE